jgi:hypothetical protein
MTTVRLVRDAKARTAVLYQYARAHDVFSELEQLLLGQGCVAQASEAHESALRVLSRLPRRAGRPRTGGTVGMTAETVYTRDTSSGRVHRRLTMPDGTLASAESCNLDDAGEYEVIASTDGVEDEALCERCFPEPDA